MLHGQGEVRGQMKCWDGREVIVFKKRPGADRKLGATRSGPQAKSHNWRFWVKGANKEANEKVLRDGDVYATGDAQGGRWVRVPRRHERDALEDVPTAPCELRGTPSIAPRRTSRSGGRRSRAPRTIRADWRARAWT